MELNEELDFDYGDEVYGSCDYEYCPRCGNFFDDADYDFQICSKCGWSQDEEYE